MEEGAKKPQKNPWRSIIFLCDSFFFFLSLQFDDPLGAFLLHFDILFDIWPDLLTQFKKEASKFQGKGLCSICSSK